MGKASFFGWRFGFSAGLVAAALATLSGACGASYAEEDDQSLFVWSDGYGGAISAGEVLEACRHWEEFGFVCREAAGPAQAHIRIHAALPGRAGFSDATERCVPGAAGVELGRAYAQGHIVVYAGCIATADGVVGVIAHEIGHTFGLPHVPQTCDPKDAVAGVPAGICGRALMNPYYGPPPHEITDMDRALWGAEFPGPMPLLWSPASVSADPR